jgi:hypothetical protein
LKNTYLDGTVPYVTVRYNSVRYGSVTLYTLNDVSYYRELICNSADIKYIYVVFSLIKNIFSFAHNYVACGGSGGSAKSVAAAIARVKILLVRTFSRFAGSPMITDAVAELNLYCYR